MGRFMLCMLLLGAALLGSILYRTNLDEVWSRLVLLGGWGLATVLLLYLAGALAATASWHLAFVALPLDFRSFRALWRPFLFGSAISMVTPLAGLGGEPVKAIMLKESRGISYLDTSASLVITSTTNAMAMVLFMVIGVIWMVAMDDLPSSYRIGVLSGLAFFTACVLGYFVMQLFRGFSRLPRWLEGFGPSAHRLAQRLVPAFKAVEEVEDRLVDFYSRQPLRFAASVGASFGEWMFEASAVYAGLYFLDHPVSFGDAIVIHTFTVLVRAILFFVPADIGTQDGSVVIACELLTGSGVLGVALAAVRRARDLLFVLWGLAVGTRSISLRSSKEPEAPIESEERGKVTEAR